jgi:hypothetical protein
LIPDPYFDRGGTGFDRHVLGHIHAVAADAK